ncbi:hypothetical protein [Salinivibrio socompensis]|uniref:hypothetical protein n=1 Tax=Salinivibrio socompensis TaxID=1510206 RepID=UPI0004724C23|nr:hypothetical protein [Salinivibrio socompensis]
MDAATQEIKRLNTLDQLTEHDSATLLEALIVRHNQESTEFDDLVSLATRAEQERDGYKRQAHTQAKEIDTLKQENEKLTAIALDAEKLASATNALRAERDQLKGQIRAAQKTIQELRGGDSPKKLREQNKRLKEKSQEKEKRNERLMRENKAYNQENRDLQAKLNKAVQKVAELQKQLEHDTGSGLYHNKEHHLIIWPQKTKMQRPDGSLFESRSLLYLHQSGRGGIVSYDPDTNSAALCAAPKNGLRMSKDTIEFAQNWLYKVNELQDGVVTEEDMIPVNYND